MTCVPKANRRVGLRKLAKVTVRRRARHQLAEPRRIEHAATRRDAISRLPWPIPRAAIWLITLFLMMATIITGSPARAEQTDPLQVSVTEISPGLLGTSGELVISGTVTNTSDATIDEVNVQLWRDATGLRTAAALQRAENSVAGGGDLSQAPGALATIGDLGPGQSGKFQVRASLDPSQASDQLWLEQPDAAYRVGVEARSGLNPTLLGANRFLMAHPGPRARTDVALLVEISSPPMRLLRADGTWTISDYRVLDDLADRVANLLTRAEQSGVNVVIDPMLYDDIELLASSGQIAGQPLSQTQSELVKTSLLRMQRLIESGRAYRTLYGSPDVLNFLSTASGAEQLRLLAALPDSHAMRKLPLFIAPADGQGSAALAESVAQLGVPTKLAVTNARAGCASMRLLADGVDLLLVPDRVADSPAVARSQRTAQLLVAGLSGTPTAALSGDADEIAAWQSHNWLKSIDLSTIPPVDCGAVSWHPPADTSDGDARPGQSRELLTLAATWAALTDHSPQLEAINRVLSGGVWSQSWRADDARASWVAANGASLQAYGQPGALRLRVPNSVTTSADDNVLPVTVVSSLDVPVTVKVHFDSTNPQRISIPDSEPFQVRPGESTTIRVRPHSQANGTVAIFAQLVSVDGHEIGEPVEFNVQATQAGKVGWIIIVVSGIVLLTTTAWRVRQVRAKQHR